MLYLGKRKEPLTKMTARSVAKSTKKPTKNAHHKHGVDDHSITRDSIISTAFDLFREKGYAKASISELARRIGMDPSSLYYYFPSKEALLAEISNPKIEIPSMEELSSFTNSRTVQLYTLIMMDVVQKCELPLDFIDVESAARKKPKSFKMFYEHYKTFYHTLLNVIESGIKEGEFCECAADERAVTILSINEGLQHHFHAKQRGELLLTDSGYTAHNHSPEDIGHMSALSVIPALIQPNIDFEKVAREGRRVYAHIVAQVD